MLQRIWSLSSTKNLLWVQRMSHACLNFALFYLCSQIDFDSKDSIGYCNFFSGILIKGRSSLKWDSWAAVLLNQRYYQTRKRLQFHVRRREYKISLGCRRLPLYTSSDNMISDAYVPPNWSRIWTWSGEMILSNEKIFRIVVERKWYWN